MRTTLITAAALLTFSSCSSDDSKYPIITLTKPLQAQVGSHELLSREQVQTSITRQQARSVFARVPGARSNITPGTFGNQVTYTYREGSRVGQVILDERGNLVVKAGIYKEPKSFIERFKDWFRDRVEPDWKKRSRGKPQRGANLQTDRWGREVRIDRDGQSYAVGNIPNGCERGC